MRKRIESYKKIVGKKKVEQILSDAEPIKGKHVVHINSTYYGGGVAEILNSLVPLMDDIGIRSGWRLLKGSQDFFMTTKKFHNAFHGTDINLTKEKKKVYEGANEFTARISHINGHDLVVVHDPQPLALIKFYKNRGQPWIWRCHVDMSSPDRGLWRYLSGFIKGYDGMVVSSEKYMKRMKIPQHIIHPSIDPLNTKNLEIGEKKVKSCLSEFGIDRDMPIITQVSRFDRLKDPIGVIKAYKKIKKKARCRLALLGNLAMDDPEGEKVYNEVKEYARGDDKIHVIAQQSDLLVNALQRASDVVIQKSIKEGFGLTVSEALWKRTPVVASRVGGIPLQVINGWNGYLVDDVDSCANRVVHLLKNPKAAEEMGEQGRKHVMENFLITRHIHDYVNLFKSYMGK